jgi:hypothetical protein
VGSGVGGQRRPAAGAGLAALFGIRQKAPQLFPRITTIIAQPGLSIAASTDEQLRLISGAASYVQSVTKGAFQVYCSA